MFTDSRLTEIDVKSCHMILLRIAQKASSDSQLRLIRTYTAGVRQGALQPKVNVIFKHNFY